MPCSTTKPFLISCHNQNKNYISDMRTSYDTVGDAFEALSNAYLDGIQALPPQSGQAVLNTAWALYRNALLALFEAHGWTEDEWDAELERRLASKVAS